MSVRITAVNNVEEIMRVDTALAITIVLTVVTTSDKGQELNGGSHSRGYCCQSCVFRAIEGSFRVLIENK